MCYKSCNLLNLKKYEICVFVADISALISSLVIGQQIRFARRDAWNAITFQISACATFVQLLIVLTLRLHYM